MGSCPAADKRDVVELKVDIDRFALLLRLLFPNRPGDIDCLLHQLPQSRWLKLVRSAGAARIGLDTMYDLSRIAGSFFNDHQALFDFVAILRHFEQMLGIAQNGPKNILN